MKNIQAKDTDDEARDKLKDATRKVVNGRVPATRKSFTDGARKAQLAFGEALKKIRESMPSE